MTPYAVDRNKWQNLTLFEQLGNIGSEVGRAYQANSRNDKQATAAAMARALDLFDATSSSLKLTPARRKEILRSKEEFLKSLVTNKDQESLEKYFKQFAIAARISR